MIFCTMMHAVLCMPCYLTMGWNKLQHLAMDSCTPLFQLGTQILQCLLKLSFRCFILSFEQQGPGAEEKEVWPLALDCCRIFSTIPLAAHTKLGSLVVHVHTPPDMPQEHIHKACSTCVFRLVISQVTVLTSSTCILPMFKMAASRQVEVSISRLQRQSNCMRLSLYTIVSNS